MKHGPRIAADLAGVLGTTPVVIPAESIISKGTVFLVELTRSIHCSKWLVGIGGGAEGIGAGKQTPEWVGHSCP